MHEIGWNGFFQSVPSSLSATDFSFWMSANLPLDNERRMQLLQQENTILRLRALVKMIVELGELGCVRCHRYRGNPKLLAHASDIFAMSSEGTVGTYVNPHGVMHQVCTLEKVEMGSLTHVGYETSK